MSIQKTSAVSERALLLLEIIAKAGSPPTLAELMASVHLPKATTHRFVTLLESLGYVQRTSDGKRYEVGYRLSALAIDAIRQSFRMAPRRAILSALVAEIGETCNITMLDGIQLVYVDRVESHWPLQLRFEVGSHVPLHCTASGKLFLSLASPQLKNALFASRTLTRYTPQTLTSTTALEAALAKIRKTNIGTDSEEFIEGMTASAVPVFDKAGNIYATVAVHGPTVRLSLARAIKLAPSLRRAAKAIEKSLLEAPASKARPSSSV